MWIFFLEIFHFFMQKLHQILARNLWYHQYNVNDFLWALYSNQSTDSTKINRPVYSVRMYWTNFRQPNAHVQQNIFGKTLIELCIPHLYASFGTLCVQIGQLFEAQWVFEKCLETLKSLLSKENDIYFEFFPKFKVSLCLE